MFFRPLSRFTCYRLSQYSYCRPRKTQLSYCFPLRKTARTTQLRQELLKNISGRLSKIGPFTIEIDSPAHIGPHSGSIDFIVPENSAILAAADGQVIELVDHFSIPLIFRRIGNYWPTRLFRGRLNYLALKHRQGKIEEFSFYAHLAKNSAQVKLGQQVKAGQVIAKTGWSGWMDRPHLHFVVYTEKVVQFPQETHESLTPLWQNQS
jgi:murein DD-endopeptidase MepM/ murein hydrolase activator NlpD